ncbi:MAG: DUF6656 family protein [Agrobacterium cavarae]|uniref:DUF6656 family protein n=1 Tax=Agrobacterium cavarae TaxID=2528239 RepID=UPI0031A7FF36
MEKETRIRYVDTKSGKVAPPTKSKTAHSDFLRTGRIGRFEETLPQGGKRYLSHEQVAEITARRLQDAGSKTHSRLNGFHPSIRFPNMVSHKLIDSTPHLGYCHVTASTTRFDKSRPVLWSFYLANFFAELCGDEHFFEKIDQTRSRMYFAVAMQPQSGGKSVTIDTSIHRGGLLFQTQDPKEALKNVLMLGTRSEELRKIIRAL